MNDSQPRQRAQWISEVLACHEGPLLRYALRLTGDVERARDTVQETFLCLCREEPDRVGDHVAAWLFRVCRHRALDAQRKESRMKTLDAQDAARCTSREASPEAVADHHETSGHVARLLATLSENQQEVVRLKFQGGLSYRDISQTTGLSESNVGFLLHTAIKKLRHGLNPAEPSGNGHASSSNASASNATAKQSSNKENGHAASDGSTAPARSASPSSSSHDSAPQPSSSQASNRTQR